MAIQTINIGNSANDGNGEPARSAFNKINQNFTNNAHAANRMVGEEAGNVMEVGAFGVGLLRDTPYISFTRDLSNIPNGFYSIENGGHAGLLIRQAGEIGLKKLGIIGFPSDVNVSAPFYYQMNLDNGKTMASQAAYKYVFRTNQNTTVDGNGFIKAASPIAKLFADKVEPNNEAAEQNITFKKIDIGHYLIQGSSGFALEGWYIETPKDANGNILFAVNYEQLKNGDIEVKTYKKKFDLESASIVADLENPVDITLNRWIDIRLQEVLKPAPDMQTEEVNSDEPQQ